MTQSTRMDQRINVITLGVADIDRSRKFYEQGLGWKRSASSNDNIAFFNAGGIVVALYSRNLLAEDATVSPDGKGFRGVTLAQNVANKDDVKKVLENAEKAGAKIVKPAQDVFWGGHSGYFSDPDGHLWEIAWNPHWQLSKDGSLRLPD